MEAVPVGDLLLSCLLYTHVAVQLLAGVACSTCMMPHSSVQLLCCLTLEYVGVIEGCEYYAMHASANPQAVVVSGCCLCAYIL